MYRQQHCSWPGQPPKPPRKVRKKDGPSGPAQKGQEAGASAEQPSIAPPATPAASTSAHPPRPAASTSAHPPRPAAPSVETTSKGARNNTPDKSGRDADDADDDNVEIVQRPTTAAGTQSFLRSGLGWSETPEEDTVFTIAELQSSFLAELQQFRRNIRICNADRDELVGIIQRLRRPMWMEVESIAASQARSDAVLLYFDRNGDEESLHGEEPTEREESGTSDDEPGPEDSDDSEDSDSGTAGEDDSDSDATA